MKNTFLKGFKNEYTFDSLCSLSITGSRFFIPVTLSEDLFRVEWVYKKSFKISKFNAIGLIILCLFFTQLVQGAGIKEKITISLAKTYPDNPIIKIKGTLFVRVTPLNNGFVFETIGSKIEEILIPITYFLKKQDIISESNFKNPGDTIEFDKYTMTLDESFRFFIMHIIY